MQSPHFPSFNSGDFVHERDSDLRGHVIGPGEYPGEWRIRCANGSETTCLSENLILMPVTETLTPTRENREQRI